MALPHTFSDGPGNTASGVEVTANDSYLEALANGKEAAFTTRPTMLFGGATFSGGAGAATYLLTGPHNANAATGAAAVGGAGTGAYAFFLDPADFLAGTRQTQYRLRAQAIVNAVAPGVTFTVGLYPPASIVSGSGAAPTIASLGSVVPSSTAVFASPGLTTNTRVDSSWFNAPAAATLCFACVVSGTIAAGSSVLILTQLYVRQV
jgi:hypothetical protein